MHDVLAARRGVLEICHTAAAAHLLDLCAARHAHARHLVRRGEAVPPELLRVRHPGDVLRVVPAGAVRAQLRLGILHLGRIEGADCMTQQYAASAPCSLETGTRGKKGRTQAMRLVHPGKARHNILHLALFAMSLAVSRSSWPIRVPEWPDGCSVSFCSSMSGSFSPTAARGS